MSCYWCLIFAGAVGLSGCGGSQPAVYAPSTPAEVQATYSRTRWYFARQLAFSKLVPEPGAPARAENATQVIFPLASGTRIIYEEFLPSTGIKAFHALGRLEPLPELASPVYVVTSPATMERPDGVMVVGFCGSRMFRVQAQGTNQQTVLADAVSFATNALANLRRQALYP